MDTFLPCTTWSAALLIAGMLLKYGQYSVGGSRGSRSLVARPQVLVHNRAMRLAIGVAEIVAALLVLAPPTRVIGGAQAHGIVSGAIFAHIVSPLGADPYGDGGALLKQACDIVSLHLDCSHRQWVDVRAGSAARWDLLYVVPAWTRASMKTLVV